MKKLLVFTIISFFFVSCLKDNISALNKKDCIKKGFLYKENKKLNYRNGKYEIKSKCFKDK